MWTASLIYLYGFEVLAIIGAPMLVGKAKGHTSGMAALISLISLLYALAIWELFTASNWAGAIYIAVALWILRPISILESIRLIGRYDIYHSRSEISLTLLICVGELVAVSFLAFYT